MEHHDCGQGFRISKMKLGYKKIHDRLFGHHHTDKNYQLLNHSPSVIRIANRDWWDANLHWIWLQFWGCRELKPNVMAQSN
jgi:hypothetical protein